jgi:beta-galactosidase/beta-glucuronidase
MHAVPRPEHPRPQFVRPSWMNLNGTWQFEMDPGASGRDRGLTERELSGTIVVPFCPESELSGVQNTDFMPAVWYRRVFTLPGDAAGRRVLLHFGAVDYQCEAWVNGRSVGVHEGGYASFTFEITEALADGENTLTVCAQDDTRGGRQPLGKQCRAYRSQGCSYTRTTGIWQTVWLEWVPRTYIRSVRMVPDAANGTLGLDRALDGDASGMALEAEATFEGAAQGAACAAADGGHARLTLAVKERRLWNAGRPNLYGLKLKLTRDGQTVDAADSYFALRTVSFDGKKCLINGEPCFSGWCWIRAFIPTGSARRPATRR